MYTGHAIDIVGCITIGDITHRLGIVGAISGLEITMI